MRITLIADNGKYVSSELGIHDIPLTANRDVAGEWEEFDELPVTGGVALQVVVTGKYVAAEPDGSVHGNRNVPGIYETFIKETLSSGKVAYRTWRWTYLTSEIGSPTVCAITNRSATPDAWQQFTRDVIGGGPTPPPIGIPVEPYADFLTLPGDVPTGYQVSPPEARAEARAASKARGYTRYCLDICKPFDNAYHDPTKALAACQELMVDGLGPWLYLAPEEIPEKEHYKGHPELLAADIRALGPVLAPYTSDVCLGVEIDETFRNFTDHFLIVKAMRDAFPTAGRWLHFTTGLWGPPGHEQAYWQTMKQLGATGLAYQYGPKQKPGPNGKGFSVSEGVMKSESARLVKFLTPLGLKLVAAEYCDQQPESTSIELGDWAIGRGAFGALNGSSGYVAPSPPNPGVDELDISQVTFLRRRAPAPDLDHAIKSWPILDTISPTHAGNKMVLHNSVVQGEAVNIWNDRKTGRWFGNMFEWVGLHAAVSWDGWNPVYLPAPNDHTFVKNGPDDTTPGTDIHVMVCHQITDGVKPDGSPVGRSNIVRVPNAKTRWT